MNRTRLVTWVAFAAGVVFAVGLGLSGMTQPEKVIGFLDVSRIPGGTWDPSLALVMGGAIVVHLYVARRAARGGKPVLASASELPTAVRIDARLVVGAALFGIGWGIGGYCPGPALVSVVAGAPATLAFVGAMILGMVLYASAFTPPPRETTSTSGNRQAELASDP